VSILNLLGIDFEDWFHPELIQKQNLTKEKIPTVVNGIDKILNWLQENDMYATFFVVGELLEYKPELLDKIIGHGHEIAFHTMHHTRIDAEGFKEKFSEEIKRFSELTGKRSRGFRAPTFSLNYESSWLIDILSENDYLYDSSIVPVKTSMYGLSNAEESPYKITSSSLERNDPNGKILEFPILTTRFMGRKIPAGGGFYLRFLPLRVLKNAIRNFEEKEIPATFYIHSWELTPEHFPKIELPFRDKFITYHNLRAALPRMTQIMKEFRFTSFERHIHHMKG
jgi:polysaccharide deacetylase family protein (PEP-CTERM system associated)